MGLNNYFEEYGYGYRCILRRHHKISINRKNKGGGHRKCTVCKRKIPNKALVLRCEKSKRINGWIRDSKDIGARFIICAYCLKEISDVANIDQHNKYIEETVAEVL